MRERTPDHRRSVVSRGLDGETTLSVQAPDGGQQVAFSFGYEDLDDEPQDPKPAQDALGIAAIQDGECGSLMQSLCVEMARRD
jgi:hypothetical protein